jgi:hypothetical protein
MRRLGAAAAATRLQRGHGLIVLLVFLLTVPAMRFVAATHPSLAGDSSLPAVAQWLQTEL